MSSVAYKEKWAFAGELLNRFVQQFDNVYGPGYITGNVHCLQHVYGDVSRFGPLSTISAYPFENKLQDLKRTITSPYRTLEQALDQSYWGARRNWHAF